MKIIVENHGFTLVFPTQQALEQEIKDLQASLDYRKKNRRKGPIFLFRRASKKGEVTEKKMQGWLHALRLTINSQYKKAYKASKNRKWPKGFWS